jgi:septation ring formation regulator EzrA
VRRDVNYEDKTDPCFAPETCGGSDLCCGCACDDEWHGDCGLPRGTIQAINETRDELRDMARSLEDVRSELARVTEERDYANECIQGWEQKWRTADNAADKRADDAIVALEAAHAETARLREERDRLEHDVDTLSKYCLGRATLFEQNPDVCQTYTELQQKAWAILSLSARGRVESERHEYVVKLDALREECDAARAETARLRERLKQAYEQLERSGDYIAFRGRIKAALTSDPEPTT